MHSIGKDYGAWFMHIHIKNVKQNLFLSLVIAFSLLSLLSCDQERRILPSLTTTVSMPLPTPRPETRTPLRTPVTKTATPKHETFTKSVSPTETNSPRIPDGALYLWTYPPGYTRLNLAEKDLSDVGDLSATARHQSLNKKMMAGGERQIIGLAFAPYSPRVAYVSMFENKVDLWLADQDLIRIDHLWQDAHNWLGKLQDPGDVRIKWGPSEQYLIIFPHYETDDHYIIYSLNSQEKIKAKGACDRIAPLPGSPKYTVWCSLGKGAPAPFVGLGVDGNFYYSETEPENSIDILEWAFDPQGQRVVVATKNKEIMVLDPNGKVIILPVKILGPYGYQTTPILQWSEDGKRILILGFNEDYCKEKPDPDSGKLREDECWSVFEAVTGENLWNPIMSEGGIHQETGFALEELNSHCARLSPDGKWIAICFNNGGIDDFLIISIDGNSIFSLGDNQLSDYKWVGPP